MRIPSWPSPRLRALQACAALALAGCAKHEGGSGGTGASIEHTLARERAAARFERFDHAGARDELAPLVALDSADDEDLVRAAAVEFALRELGRATEFLARIEARGSPLPAAEFLRGQVARENGHGAQAVQHFRAALQLAPADLGTRIALAETLNALGRTGDAESEYRIVFELGIENGGSWYVAALLRLERSLRAAARDEEAAPLTARIAELEAAGLRPPGDSLLRLGTLGRLAPPWPSGSATEPAQELRFVEHGRVMPEFAGARELAAHDLDGDLRADLVALLPAAVVLARNTGSGFELSRVFEGEASLVRAFDLDNDVDLDLAIATADGLRFWLAREGEHRPAEIVAPSLPSAALDCVAVDFDHDGDLDLALAGAFGARLWRNDGAWVEGGAFADATLEAGLRGDAHFRWCASEDLDGDGDVDLVFGGDGDTYLADNLRAGRFAERSERFQPPFASPTRPALSDFDADGRCDLMGLDPPGGLWRQGLDGRFRPSVPPSGAAAPRDLPPPVVAVDADLDGALDLVGDGAALLAAGLPQAGRVLSNGWPSGGARRPFCCADFDGDLVPDAALASEDGVRVLRGLDPAGRGLLVRLVGARDNRRAVGAVVELRAGRIYRRLYYRGDPAILGVGAGEAVDVFRIRWPNGLTQTALDRGLDEYTMGTVTPDSPPGELDQDLRFGDVQQEDQLIGSCPFLYTWDGTTWRFVTDVLGITPLGLRMGPGVMVPPDHDEYVLVRGEELAPRGGRLELQVTEELREVTYLDRVRLEVVDHPAGTEVFPNERFCFPPFPAPHVHSLRAPLAPVRALGSDGRDWRAELAHIDDRHALPFEKEPPQFQGLAKPWFLELEFDARAIAAARKLRLVLTGWLRWSDASSNMAAARHPGVDFVPPMLQVPDGEGGWLDAGPSIGFPAGKTKTMVIDVAGLDLAHHGQLRIASTLQLHWDRIVLAVDGDDAPLAITALEPLEARLWERGFSAPVASDRADLPERFDWWRLAPHPRFDPHPGLTTRLGNCLELLGAIDDRYVILAAGDALSIAFDASALPPLSEGSVRDYLVFFDGWAKDRDPNTLEALAVEPLPFHGMSGYPYGPGETFPEDAEHERWRRVWNTRVPRRWVAPLAGGE